jgi:hypothetical protein
MMCFFQALLFKARVSSQLSGILQPGHYVTEMHAPRQATFMTEPADNNQLTNWLTLQYSSLPCKLLVLAGGKLLYVGLQCSHLCLVISSLLSQISLHVLA